MKPGPKLGFRGTEEERFWSKVRIAENGCWEWQASINPWGYGVFCLQGTRKRVLAMRWAYTRYVGPIPDYLEPDHLCRNRKCINPFHLEPVTHRINLLRGTGVSARNAKKTHCPQGHPYAGENLRLTKHGYRICKICKSKADAQWYKNNNKKDQHECQDN